MVTIKENNTKTIEKLENLLEDCIETETVVRIHSNINDFIIRCSSVLDEFHIDYDELYLVCGWFELDFKGKITEICYDEEENSIHIIFDNGEVYLDLDKNNT